MQLPYSLFIKFIFEIISIELDLSCVDSIIIIEIRNPDKKLHLTILIHKFTKNCNNMKSIIFILLLGFISAHAAVEDR